MPEVSKILNFTTRKLKPGEWLEFQTISRDHKLKYDIRCRENSITFTFDTAVDAVLFRLATSDLLPEASEPS